MSFKFKARVLLELGAELISSDAVALYELIKNALDAGSKEIDIRIRIAMQHSAYTQLRTLLLQHIQEARSRKSAAATFDSDQFHAMVLQQLEDQASPTTRERFIDAYGEPATPQEALEALEHAYLWGNLLAPMEY